MDCGLMLRRPRWVAALSRKRFAMRLRCAYSCAAARRHDAVELLVVVAIIGVLAAILLPAVQAAGKRRGGASVRTICGRSASRCTRTTTRTASFQSAALTSACQDESEWAAIGLVGDILAESGRADAVAADGF